jgi:hypothetical protein
VRESADGRLSRDPTLALRDRDERRVRDHGDDEGPSGRDEAPGKEGKLVRWHVQF